MERAVLSRLARVPRGPEQAARRYALPDSTRGKISHSLPMMSGDRSRLKDGGAPPFSSAGQAWHLSSSGGGRRRKS